MAVDTLNEVVDLLEKIIVFAIKFKKEILARAEKLSEAKLAGLKKVLTEVAEWQKLTLQALARKDPQFYRRLLAKKKTIEQEMINLYKTKLAEEDNKKMQIILNKMKSI